MDQRDSYKATTLRILGQFQLVEFVLKHYIGFSYKPVQQRLDSLIHFGYSLEDVENHPLEKLLNIFSKLNTNAPLQEKLNKLRTKRNHLVHRSLLVALAAGSAFAP